MTRILICAVMFALLVCGGCRSFEPPHRAEHVAFDETLLGSWVRANPDALEGDTQSVVRVTRRDIAIRNGRLAPLGPVRTDGTEPQRLAHAYSIVSDAEKNSPTAQRIAAYLLRCGGKEFLGVQIETSELGMLSGFGVIPVHVLWMVERNHDRVAFRSPKNPVVWTPALRPIDPPAKGSPDVPTLESLKGEGLPFTSDIDRLLRIYVAQAGNPSFWDDAREYRRVAE